MGDQSKRQLGMLEGSYEDKWAFIIQSPVLERAHGIGTVLFDQVLIHPRIGRIAGHDVDYWLDSIADGDIDAHTGVARILINTAATEVSRNYRVRNKTDLPVMAALDPHQQRFPKGLAKLLFPLGEPAVLATEPAEDPLGLTKGGAELQIYIRGKIKLPQET